MYECVEIHLRCNQSDLTPCPFLCVADKWAEAAGFSEPPRVSHDMLSQYYHDYREAPPGDKPTAQSDAGLVCRVCQYFTTKMYNMKRHVLKHMPEHRFKCPLCHKGFIDRYQLSQHARKKHPELLLLTEPPESSTFPVVTEEG